MAGEATGIGPSSVIKGYRDTNPAAQEGREPLGITAAEREARDRPVVAATVHHQEAVQALTVMRTVVQLLL